VRASTSPAPSTPRGRATEARSARRTDLLLLAGLSAGLLVWFLWPYVRGGFRFPLGPDAPVYLWWIRLAGAEGLSAVGHRPGVPALALTLQGTLGLSPVPVVAGLEGALGISVGLASAALVRGRHDSRTAWILAGALAGTFAVHLAAGYLANLAFAVAFLATAAALAEGTRRGAVAAAVLLGAGGLAHPLFLLLGLAILGLSAALAWRTERGEPVRVIGAALGGAAIAGAGLLALLAGPGPLPVDTSRDGFLRRAGMTGELRSAYLDRFVHRWARYVQWASVPLAIVGLREAKGFLGRFLRAWGLTLLAGVAVALVTGWIPPDRFVTFGFVVPILAALGLVRLWRALGARRTLALLATGLLTLAMLAGAMIAWSRQEPFMSELEVARISAAARSAAGFPPGTPLVFFVNDEDATTSFLATRAANLIRAGMPPDRIRDVFVVVPPAAESAPTNPEREALVRLWERDVQDAPNADRAVTILLAPFDRVDLARVRSLPDARVSRGVFVQPRPAAPGSVSGEPLEPSSPGAIAWATVGTLALLLLAGYGWARAALADALHVGMLAPAFGLAALTLVAIALERLGLPPDGGSRGILVSALAGGGGYLAWFVLERRARARPAPQVEEEPGK